MKCPREEYNTIEITKLGMAIKQEMVIGAAGSHTHTHNGFRRPYINCKRV